MAPGVFAATIPPLILALICVAIKLLASNKNSVIIYSSLQVVLSLSSILNFV